MKTFEKVILALILAAVLVLPLAVLLVSTVVAVSRETAVLPVRVTVQGHNGAVLRLPGVSTLQVPNGDQLVLGGTYELSEGETLEGSLVVIGGVATLNSGSVVEHDVVLMGGTLQVLGTIEGDVVSIGGSVNLDASAVVEGDVNIISGNLQRAEGARIEGRVNRSTSGPYSVPLVFPTSQIWIPGFAGENILWQGLFLLGRSILWAIVALLVVLLLPNHSERVRKAVVEKTGVSIGLGLLTMVVAPLLLVVMAITIIGIPVSLLGIFVLALGWAFGVIVVGLEVGKRLVQAARQEWAPAVAAGLGTFLVTLVGNVIGVVVPCVGWMVPVLVGLLGLGAVLITRFGTQDYQSSGGLDRNGALPQPVEPVAPVEIAEAEEATPEE